ncbi:MAG: type I-E CRISPR-associated endoribonuclease Cas2 [Gammaproteobacteria bacterium]|nr:MAG: type I-E CRISPR-associated endoribonuclease Cas2 [Gammaproteobacteria bacterium]
MSTVVVVARAASKRMRGFLASSMLEVTPGVYVAPQMNPRVRERVWDIVHEWFACEQQGASVVMLWRDPSIPDLAGIRILGDPPVDFVEQDGLILARRPRIGAPSGSDKDGSPPSP